MKRLVMMALLTAGCFTINAQSDPKAKSILDELSAKTKAYTTIKADFAYVIEKKDNSKETQNGKIQIKGDKYKLEITGHDIYCDGKTVWDFIKDANEVQVKDMVEGEEDAVNPSTIFTLYENGYKYKFDGEDAVNQTISLFPTNPDKKKFHTVKLTIDKTKKQITSVKMMMKDGSTQLFTIKSFTTNAPIADSEFVFNPKAHPGVSVEDLR
ncbi:MAG TPA: outer membrane lipoprotein carrier protein LolA [Bacteroidia bacterium]|nr:outer membrane lipoprotein carrier protein LolA [Bacteroidia bacterium]